MLKKLQIKNFKAFKNVGPINIAPITLFFGDNSSGKSSIIKALLGLKQTIESKNTDIAFQTTGEFVDLGAYYNFIHDNETDETFSILLTLETMQINLDYILKSIGGVEVILLDKLEMKPLSDIKLRNRLFTSLKRIVVEDLLIHQIPFDSEDLTGFAMEAKLENKTSIKSKPKYKINFERNKINKLYFKLLLLHFQNYSKKFQQYKHQSKVNPNQIKLLDLDYDDIVASIEFNLSKNWMVSSNIEGGIIIHLYALIEDVKSKEKTYQKIITDSSSISLNMIENNRFILDAETMTRYESDLRNVDKNLFPLIKEKIIEKLTGITTVFQEKIFGSYEGNLLFEEPFAVREFNETKEISDEYYEIFNLIDFNFQRITALIFNITFSEMLNNINKFIGKLIYIGPYRSLYERYFSINNYIPRNVGKNGSDTVSLLFHNMEKIPDFNSSLRKFDIGYEVKLNKINNELVSLLLKDNLTNVASNLIDIGFGIGQILPILVQSYFGESDEILIIEQPELHLNPKLQAEFGEFLGLQSKNGRTYIIETHSEQLILRLMKLVRNGKLDASQISINYISKTEFGSILKEIKLNDEGDFVNPWPDDFFELSYKEIFDEED